MGEDTATPHLLERDGPSPGRRHAMPYGEHLVGRGRGVSIVLDGNDVSRRHARLEVDVTGVVVHDLGSKNGVYADGARVVDPIRVSHGGTIEIGGIKLDVVHPQARITGILARAGEPTVTRSRGQGERATASPSLLMPLIGVAVFGGLVAALLLL